MENNKVNGMMDTAMEKIKGMVDVNTVIGKEIISQDGTVIIPVSKLSYGFAAGGSDFASKKCETKDLFGGGSGAAITVTPVAFLVIRNGDVKMLQVESFTGAVDRIISMVPDIADKIGNMIKSHKNKKDSPGDNEQNKFNK